MKYSCRWVTTWLLVMGITAATRCDVLLADDLVRSDRLMSQEPSATGFIETWEGAATSRLAEGPWQLTGGVWGAVAQQDVSGAGRKYAVVPGQVSRLRRAVSFSGQDHVVVEGWLYDPGPDTHSMLGLASSDMVESAATIRIGAAGQGTYRIQYYEAQGSTPTMRDIDSGAAVEPGWHLLRLDLWREFESPQNWLAKWRIWNADRTVEKRGAFRLAFDADSVAWATLGSSIASTGDCGWDEVRVGSLQLVGPPPVLPHPARVTLNASSQLDGWEVNKLADGDAQTVFSSGGHGEQSDATEWVALDFGMAATWNGQARETPPGTIRHYPGDREPFAAARHAIRNVWGSVADDPAKYDDFVDVGMAAWLESDPWNLWPGLPSGHLGPTAPLGRSSWPSMPWSNLAATLAYSDKYVWTWSEKTNYSIPAACS